MTGIETGVALLTKIFLFTSFVGQNWIYSMIIILASMVIITRRWNDWKILAFPVMLGWRQAGLYLPYLFYIIAILAFVIETLSLKVVGDAIRGSVDTIVSITSEEGRLRRMARKTQRKEYMSNLREFGTTDKKELKEWIKRREQSERNAGKQARILDMQEGTDLSRIMEEQKERLKRKKNKTTKPLSEWEI